MQTCKPYLQLAVSGVCSGVLYLLVFIYEQEIIAGFTRTDGFYPALPVATAFIFSFVHGAFASYFWEVIGIRGRMAAKKR